MGGLCLTHHRLRCLRYFKSCCNMVLHQGMTKAKELSQVCCIKNDHTSYECNFLATSIGALQEQHQLPERMSYDDRLGRIQELPKTCSFHALFIF